MNCKNCGGIINGGDKFCQSCGTAIDNTNTQGNQSNNTGNICPACGANVSSDDKFCGICGSAIYNATQNNSQSAQQTYQQQAYQQQIPSQQNTPTTDNNDNSKLVILLIIIIGLIIVALVCGSILFLTKNSIVETSKNIPTQNSIATTAPTAQPTPTPAPTAVPAPHFDNIVASSTRGADYTAGYAITYELEKAFDKSYETAWTCDRHYELTPTITFTANTPQYVSGIKIANGYFKSEDTYKYNRRITKFLIEYDGGQTIHTCGTDQYRIMQDIKFEKPVPTSTLKINVLETVDGKWHDIAISEIEIY